MSRDPGPVSRRAFLASAGTAATAALAGCTGDDGLPSSWVVAETPTGKRLNDVVVTRDGPYAVGESGHVIARCHVGWATLLRMGPEREGNGLLACAVSDDGRDLWFCGESGAIGRYDVTAREVTDHSAPGGKTSTWEAVAVAGPAGEERVYLVNGSGELLSGAFDGDQVDWGDPLKPGGGSSASTVAFAENGFGYVADTDARVYKTVGDGEWRDVGIDAASVPLFDLAPHGKEAVSAAADDGRVFRYDGFDWTELQVGSAALYGLARGSHDGVAVGEDGVVYELSPDGWRQHEFRASGALYGVALGTAKFPTVAVGENGTVLRRVPGDDATRTTRSHVEHPERHLPR